MANRVRPIAVSEADRHELERLHRASSTPSGLSRRARTVLLMAPTSRVSSPFAIADRAPDAEPAPADQLARCRSVMT